MIDHKKNKKNLLKGWFLAILSGVLLGISSPAINFWALGFISLIPLYYSLEKNHSFINTVILGFITGTIATAIYTWPLASASTWQGWAEYTKEETLSHQATYQSSLYVIWILLSVFGGGVLFSIFSIFFKWLQKKKPVLTLLISAPIFWLLIIEYGRSLMFFDYQWMPIGSSLINVPWLAQLAAYGGVWLLGAIVLYTNGLLYFIFSRMKKLDKLMKRALIGTIPLFILTVIGGVRYSTINTQQQNIKPIKVATIQLSQTLYTENDFTPFYMDKHYLRLVKQAYEKHSDKFDILVLPESIGFGNVSLDGQKSQNTPEKTLSTIQDWYDSIKPLILKPSLLIFGVDTVEKTKDYNSIVVWNEKGPIWKYHKQRLVPFAESIPEKLKILGLKGTSTYSYGTKTSNLKLNNVQIGFFICQEVLFSDIIKKSVLEGAEFLITVGNDGVFSNPSVAENNAIAARFRAIESGRYIVRSMKSGISAIITPTGIEKVSIGNFKKGFVSSKIIPRQEITIYTRLHDHILWILLIFSMIVIFASMYKPTSHKTTHSNI